MKARKFLDPPDPAEIIRHMPCIICRREIHPSYGPSEVAHIKHRGMGNKDVPFLGNVVPLCHTHHRGLHGFHQLGVQSFQSFYHVNLAAEAVKTQQYVESKT